VGASDIFGLSTGESDGGLLLGAPAGGTTSQGKDIARRSLVVINIAGPIGVGVAKKSRDTGGAAAQDQLVVGSCP
jgi:hypothetical protein